MVTSQVVGGLSGCLGLPLLLPDFAPLLPWVGLQSVLVSSPSLSLGGVLRSAPTNAPTSAERCPDSLTESALQLLPCRQGKLLEDFNPLIVSEPVLVAILIPVHPLACLPLQLPSEATQE